MACLEFSWNTLLIHHTLDNYLFFRDHLGFVLGRRCWLLICLLGLDFRCLSRYRLHHWFSRLVELFPESFLFLINVEPTQKTAFRMGRNHMCFLDNEYGGDVDKSHTNVLIIRLIKNNEHSLSGWSMFFFLSHTTLIFLNTWHIEYRMDMTTFVLMSSYHVGRY